MSDAKAIRKHTAQHDLFNRLHSIAADESFVKKVAGNWYDGRFEVVPNQRCGTWYCDPSSSSKAYAYFKSTDGHTNNWNFNLRRSNLPFAQYAEEKGGLILVDSTRRGKRMPDALSKTVPIWCTVINIAIQLRREEEMDDWDMTLYLPPNIVSPSEREQIQAMLPTWAAALETSTLPLPSLTKPLRPFFIHPATISPPQIPANPPYTPILCVSASRWVGNGDNIPSVTRIGGSTVGFEYVPGAGDDDELWARGLKPALYHSKRTELLEAERDELPDLVDELVGEITELSLDSLVLDNSIVGVPDPDSPFAVDLGTPVTSFDPWRRSGGPSAFVAEFDRLPKDAPMISFLKGDMYCYVPNPRVDGKAYNAFLTEFIRQAKPMRSVIIRPISRSALDAARRGEQILLAVHPTELVPARKVVIPILVALVCSMRENADKGVIADELHRLVSLWPDGNPPRAALKRVNDVLMSNNQ